MKTDGVDSYQPLFAEDTSDILISPKQLQIVQISIDRAIQLNHQWHSRLPKIAKFGAQGGLYFGAVFQSKIYAIAIWSLPIAANRLKDGYKLLELRRMAINDQAPKNTASYMIGKMIKEIRKLRPEVIKLISY